MRYHIAEESGLQAVLAQNNEVMFLPQTVSSGAAWFGARDQYTIQPVLGTIIINGNTNYTFQSKKIVIVSGTRFSPGSGGKITLKVNPHCN